ncbi:3-dehydroquinate synthase [Halonatronum saccharophilum]|uniref:3-dehydroquinate synthase n=1 Tax=Halonatronum saccharophilum TaxID=150060 RepID=UPI00048771EC|nr:3-dehydroquinate synthase [Halonatronum saccharophilum]
MEEVRINLGERSYDIKIGEGILDRIGEYLKDLDLGPKVLLISNDLVYSLYGERAKNSIEDGGFSVKVAKIGDGEKYKSLDTAKDLYDKAVDFGLDRSSTVVALGGGVVGDIGGFIAATYMRGINFVQIPTTVLSQVDSSVGGKVAVNHPLGKNLIGNFYQPKLVVADIEVLETLEKRELKAGLAEVIKYGVIWDEQFFDFLIDNKSEIFNLDTKALIHLIKKSCQIKAQVVSKDEREEGLRAILNYGHTIGHAIEAVSNYKKYVHGEGVSIGMVGAAKIAFREGLLSEEDLIKQENILKSYGLPTSYDDLKVEAIIRALKKDKKVKSGELRFILAKKVGEVVITSDVNTNNIKEVVNELGRE